MARVQSLDIDAPSSPRRPRNPYGPGGGGHSTPVTAPRTYLMFGLALFVIWSVGKMMLPSDESNDEWAGAGKGDAAGGWGSEHNHPVGVRSSALGGAGGGISYTPPVANSNSWSTVPGESSYDGEDEDDDEDEWSSEGYGGGGWEEDTQSAWLPDGSSQDSSFSNADLELREADLLVILSPVVIVPTHSRTEYERYQQDSGMDAESIAGEVLNDMTTPHGKAFDFMLNRDTRPIGHEDAHVVQRFVLTLLFYATGGKDEVAASTHFLTSMHECHWNKKGGSSDPFWGLLSSDDQRVGVTKCNADMEVTEIRLANLNLFGFVPEEIKWLSSLESFDIQRNHLGGPIPGSIGELDELRYLSLDGNSFSGTIPDVFYNMLHLERAYLNSNDFNGSMPPSLCSLREDGELEDLWSDCGGFPVTCTCCTVCCDLLDDCVEMDSQKGG